MVSRPQKCKITRHQWQSPVYGIEFRFPKIALEFEALRKQCGGDEDEAWELFRKRDDDVVWNGVDGALNGLEKAKERMMRIGEEKQDGGGDGDDGCGREDSI